MAQVEIISSTTGVTDNQRLQNTATAANNSGSSLSFGANRTTSGLTDVASVQGLITDITENAYKGALVLATADNAPPAERMRIDRSGNVGVGTTAPSSRLDITTDSLGSSQTVSSGLALVNRTAAADSAQQISPALRWSGSGWKTDSTAASQRVDFRAYAVPVQGTAAPTGYLAFESSINGGGYTNLMVVDVDGNVGIGTTDPGLAGQSWGNRVLRNTDDDTYNLLGFFNEAGDDCGYVDTWEGRATLWLTDPDSPNGEVFLDPRGEGRASRELLRHVRRRQWIREDAAHGTVPIGCRATNRNRAV